MRKRIKHTQIKQPYCDSMVAPFKRAFCGGAGKAMSFKNGRLDVKQFVNRNVEGFFKREQFSPDGKPEITLIVDCSGSMGGEPIEEAANLCAILSRLHRMDLVSAHIILSGWGGDEKTTGFAVPMPQPDFVWDRLVAKHGGEALSQTFNMHRDKLAKSDVVACYTDADICDDDLEPSLWRRHGISCVGLYCGSPRQVDVMLRYFDYAIARSTYQDLFMEFLTLISQLLRR